MASRKWWIKRRINPQIGEYYVPMGVLSTKAARQHERPIYGDNVMLAFDSEDEYHERLAELRASGSVVHGEA